MNRLPSNLVGREVILIMNSGDELDGNCTMASENYITLQHCSWEYTFAAEAIAAISVNREGKA